MLEVLNDPLFQSGVAFGVVLIGVTLFICGQCIPAKHSVPKWHIKNRDSLIGKLRAAGYTVYRPSIMGCDLQLKTPLTPDDQYAMALESMVVFDPNGKPVTVLLPMTTESEEIAETRRGQFRVISGGKHDGAAGT